MLRTTVSETPAIENKKQAIIKNMAKEAVWARWVHMRIVVRIQMGLVVLG